MDGSIDSALCIQRNFTDKPGHVLCFDIGVVDVLVIEVRCAVWNRHFGKKRELRRIGCASRRRRNCTVDEGELQIFPRFQKWASTLLCSRFFKVGFFNPQPLPSERRVNYPLRREYMNAERCVARENRSSPPHRIIPP